MTLDICRDKYLDQTEGLAVVRDLPNDGQSHFFLKSAQLVTEVISPAASSNLKILLRFIIAKITCAGRIGLPLGRINGSGSKQHCQYSLI